MKKYIFLFLVICTSNIFSMYSDSEFSLFEYLLENSQNSYENSNDLNIPNLNEDSSDFPSLQAMLFSQENDNTKLNNQPSPKKFKVKKNKKKQRRKRSLSQKVKDKKLVQAKKFYKENKKKYEKNNFTESEIINDLVEKVYENAKVHKIRIAKKIFKEEDDRIKKWIKQDKKIKKERNVKNAKTFRRRRKEKLNQMIDQVSQMKDQLKRIKDLIINYKNNDSENSKKPNLTLESILTIIKESKLDN